jgi:hypothetical protein
VLIVAGEVADDLGVASLVAAWTQERLPILRIDTDLFAASDLETKLEEIGATTLVVAGAREACIDATRGAAERGFRVFLVAEPPVAGLSAEEVRIVTIETAVTAALGARGRERWKAAREAALLERDAVNPKR